MNELELIIEAESRQRACRRAVRMIAAQAHNDLMDVDITLTAIACLPEFNILFKDQDEERRRQILEGIKECGLEQADMLLL